MTTALLKTANARSSNARVIAIADVIAATLIVSIPRVRVDLPFTMHIVPVYRMLLHATALAIATAVIPIVWLVNRYGIVID